jgi:hypothetical protein
LFKTKPLNRLTGQVIGGWLSLSYDGWTQEHVQQHHPYLNRSVCHISCKNSPKSQGTEVV